MTDRKARSTHITKEEVLAVIDWNGCVTRRPLMMITESRLGQTGDMKGPTEHNSGG